jgi:Ni/Fe-hydrogenase subunit HybB-like protein
MIPEIKIPEIVGYAFPNDIHIVWSLMIVLYPYITGIVAGAFIISSLYHVFGREELEPVNRLCLATSLGFLLFATLPLLNHLGHPERSFNIFITPHFSSAIAGFSVLYNTYFVILVLEMWFVWRRDIIILARRSRGLKRTFYAVLALGTYNISDEALKKDKAVIVVLAALGIPSASLLHGYVGFLFGAIKANPWWSTPLMPIIFLTSGVTSGIAILIIIYQVGARIRGMGVRSDTISSLNRWLWLFMIITVTLELLEIISLAYERAEEWEVIRYLLSRPLLFSFVSIQLVLGSLIPFILLLIAVVMDKSLTDKVRNVLSTTAALLLLIQVFAMRWNVVIGGQLLSKSFRGFRSTYTPHLFEKEGILAAIIIFLLPFLALWIMGKILPIYEKMELPGRKEGQVEGA